MKLGNLRDGQPCEVKSNRTGEIFTLFRSVTEGTGIEDLVVMHEELPPGHRTSSPHYHTLKNELYIVLKGKPTAQVDGIKFEMATGDYIVFESKQNETHCLINEGNDPVELLTVSSCPPEDVIVYETDNRTSTINAPVSEHVPA